MTFDMNRVAGAAIVLLNLAVAGYSEPPAVTAPEHVKGAIEQFNYGPDGRVNGLIISPKMLIYIAPQWAHRLEIGAHPGDEVRATGVLEHVASSIQILQPTDLEVGGLHFCLSDSTGPVPYAANGTVKQLNYGPQGEVDGFVLDDGTQVRIAAGGHQNLSSLKPGDSIGVSGFSYITNAGRTVVELDHVIQNGKTIAAR